MCSPPKQCSDGIMKGLCMDPRISRWAKTLVGYCLEVEPGDIVVIAATSAAEPLIAEVYREVLRAGGHPVAAIRLPNSPKHYCVRATTTSCRGSTPPTV